MYNKLKIQIVNKLHYINDYIFYYFCCFMYILLQVIKKIQK